MQEQVPTRSGFVTLIGRPNAGKSTLLNAVLGQDISIATPKPQTTRHRILGVHHVEDRGQIAFLDTPGIHRDTRGRILNKRMVQLALDAVRESDAVLWVLDVESALRQPDRPLWGEDEDILGLLQQSGRPVVLALNKVDRVKDKGRILPALASIGELGFFRDVVPVSALRGSQLDTLVQVLWALLPEGPALFPAEMVTDRMERFLAEERIREQVLLQTSQEVPYGVAVEVERFSERAEDGVLEISALLHVERDTQKAIVIGRQGARLKEIGTAARLRLESFFGRKVMLHLLVRVQRDWTTRPADVTRFLGESGEQP